MASILLAILSVLLLKPLPCRGALGAPRLELRSWEEAEAMADETLQQMTAVERRSLMRGTGWHLPDPTSGRALPTPTDGMYDGNTWAIPRLGVPPLKLHSGAAGFRPHGGVDALGTSTAWPSALALATTWDEGLVARVARAVAVEFRAKGANALLGPAVQVHRVARGGRNFECLSGDDPYLGARLAAAYVRALQGEGVMACVKHWAFNEQELGQADSSSSVDERTAWELYYPPFDAAVQAGAGCVACAHNRVNGTWACENEKLLRVDLKGKMGFRGFVLSSPLAARSTSVSQGLDLEMPGLQGLFSEERLVCWETPQCNPGGALPPGFAEEPVRRFLAAVYRSGLEEAPGCEPGPTCWAAQQQDVTSAAHRELALEAALRSIVLLKNDGALPIDPTRVRRLALIGMVIDEPQSHAEGDALPADYYSGGGTGHVGAGSVVTPRMGIEARAKAAGVEVLARATTLLAVAWEAARHADLVVFVGGATATQGSDRISLDLDHQANHMIEQLAAERPTVVLMQTPGLVLTPWRGHPNVSAIAGLFLGGEQTGAAWAAALFGDASPSGKLPVALPASGDAVVEPTFEATYAEGLHTSYRHPSAGYAAAFPFGHGLSYTAFAFGDLSLLPLAACAGAAQAWQKARPVAACLGLSVTNVGNHSGSEVLQAYVEFPREAEMPRLMLKGFHRTEVLAPGAMELALFALTTRDLSTYRVDAGGWKLHIRTKIHVGASSANLSHSLDLELPAVTDSGNASPGAAVGPGVRAAL